jgi:hypothetical protein
MFFKKKIADIEFVDKSRLAYVNIPIQRAQDVKPKYIEIQKQKHGHFAFSLCPGMFDLYKAGYIIPAWCDIHIKANKAGVVTILGGTRGRVQFEQPRFMNESFIDGMLEPQDGVPLKAVHVGAPWSIFTPKNISAWLGPATYHSTFLDDIQVWPGIVDYKNFHTANFIFSPKRACEVLIKAGDPLIHVIPFLNHEMNASYGPGTEEQIDANKNQMISQSETQTYRKNLMTKKVFELKAK